MNAFFSILSVLRSQSQHVYDNMASHVTTYKKQKNHIAQRKYSKGTLKYKILLRHSQRQLHTTLIQKS